MDEGLSLLWARRNKVGDYWGLPWTMDYHGLLVPWTHMDYHWTTMDYHLIIRALKPKVPVSFVSNASPAVLSGQGAALV